VCAAVCCSVLRRVGGVLRRERDTKENKAKIVRVTACCSVLQCAAVCCSVFRLIGVLRRERDDKENKAKIVSVTACCSVLQLHTNEMSPMLKTDGTILYSLLYINLRLVSSRLKCV